MYDFLSIETFTLNHHKYLWQTTAYPVLSQAAAGHDKKPIFSFITLIKKFFSYEKV